jgi:hypothetical protein
LVRKGSLKYLVCSEISEKLRYFGAKVPKSTTKSRGTI